MNENISKKEIAFLRACIVNSLIVSNKKECGILFHLWIAVYGISTEIYGSEAYSECCQTSKIQRFAKIVNGLLAVNYFYKTFHLRCLIGFWIRLRSAVHQLTYLIHIRKYTYTMKPRISSIYTQCMRIDKFFLYQYKTAED